MGFLQKNCLPIQIPNEPCFGILQFIKIQNFMQNKKNSNLVFQSIVIFEISTLEFFKMQIFIQNEKIETKNGYFKVKFKKAVVAFDTSTL